MSEIEKLAKKMADVASMGLRENRASALKPYADEGHAQGAAGGSVKNVLRGDESQMKQWAKRNLEMRNDLDRTVLARDEARAEVERLRNVLTATQVRANQLSAEVDVLRSLLKTTKVALHASGGAQAMSEPESLEQIARQLAPPHSEVCRSHASGVCDCWRTRQRIAILAALLEAEALGEQRAAALGGALLDSAIERAEKAEAEHGVLRRYVGSEIYMSDFRSVSQMRAALNKATALAAERMELLTVAVNTGAAAYERAEKAERLVSLAEKEAIAFRDQMHEERIRANKAEAEVVAAKREAFEEAAKIADGYGLCDDVKALHGMDIGRAVARTIRSLANERAEKAERDLRDIIENDEGQRERANKLEVENMRLFEGAATQAANVLEQHKVELSALRAEVERLRNELTATQVRANELARLKNPKP